MDKKNEKLGLAFDNLYDDGDFFWFTSYYFNALYKMDKVSFKTEYIGMFPDEPLVCNRMYGDIVEVDKKLYFAPFSLNVNKIGIYDKRTGQFSGIEWKNKGIETIEGGDRGFKSAHVYGDNVYFMPYQQNAMIKLNTNTWELEALHNVVDCIKEKKGSYGDRIFYSTLQQGNIVYAPSAGTNAIVKIDLDKETAVCFNVGDEDSMFFGIVRYMGGYFLSPLSGSVMPVWREEGCIREIRFTPQKLPWQYIGANIIGNKIILMPYFGKRLEILNGEENDTKYSYIYEYKIDELIPRYEGVNTVINNVLYLYDMVACELIVVSSNGIVKRKEIIGDVSENIINELRQNIKTGLISENKIWNLVSFIKYIV